jgi:cell division protein FtsQ
MAGGRSARGSRRSSAAASVVVPFPRGAAGARLDLARFVPSGRWLLATLGALAAIGLAYWAAYATPLFALEHVDVRGAPPALTQEVIRATGDLAGRSLVAVDPAQVEGEVRALPAVAGVTVDRAFPHTLVIRIAPEKPVAVVRRGHSAWLATGSGKVIAAIPTGTQRGLPRLWLGRGTSVRVGGAVPPGMVPATRALADARSAGLGGRVRGIRTTGDELTLVLRHGTELRLGRASEVELKLVIARRVLALVDGTPAYVDVSIPERPVAG